MRTTPSLALALFAASALSASDALACGGTFCSSSPVSQNAERILFIKQPGHDTTAVVQIQAQGNDPNFAWVVPVDSIPHDIHEEPTSTFNLIDSLTAPRYLFSNGFGFSPTSSGSLGCGASADAARPTLAEGPSESSAVHVWASGETSNFHYDIVSSVDPAALQVWLNNNSYRTPDEALPIITEYVGEHKFFIAFRLHAVPGVASFLVSPIAFSYEGDTPCVPIRLTRIATAPTLPILTYVISTARAIPNNFVMTSVSDAEVARLGPSMFSGGTVYDGLVTSAINQAGGRAWITEYAGSIPDGVRESFSPQLQALLPPEAYVTRMYTTLSADRMDRDPEFRFTRQLPDVSRTHDLSEYVSRGFIVDLRFLFGASTLVAGVRALRLRRRARR